MVFDWDIDTGEVSGPGARQIKELASDGSISYQPIWHTFSADPLKNKTDMASILGFEHAIPDDLAAFFPVMPDDGTPEFTYVDQDGVTVIGRDQMLY